MNAPRPILFLTGLVLSLLAACNRGSDAEQAEPAVLSGPDTVYGLANMDNLGKDFDAEDASDDEIVFFEVVPTPGVDAATYRFTLDGKLSTRVWYDGEIVATGDETFEVDGQTEPIQLGVEFRDFNTGAELLVEELDDTGEVLHDLEIDLISSPLLLNHHLQPAEQVVATSVAYYGVDNAAFIDGYEAALGERFESARGQAYGQDPWMQDEIEFAYSITPEGEGLDMVIDSIRNRGLDDYPEDVWAGESFGVKTWGFGYASSQDSFGNLEVSPPVDDYPFGRIYYGASGGFLDPQAQKLYDVLDNNKVQEPFQVDISWLCVGHVDEFMTFVPDSTAPRGFRFVINDVPAAYEILEAMDPATPLPRYAGRFNHDYATVGEIVNDTGLRQHNEDIQRDHLDPTTQQMIDELGLLPEEILLMPGLFEEVGYCGRTNAALIPGMANLIVANFEGDPKLFIADPFIRSDLDDQDSDPMIQAVRDLMPAELDIQFLDDWDVYHLGLGEVHCGSNVLRTPSTADWWTNDLGGSK